MKKSEAGVTLVEMIAVVTIIGLVAAISFPSVSSGLESIRLTSATDSIGAFLNGGLNRAERRQQGVEIAISIPERSLTMQSTEPGFERTLVLPDGVTIVRIHPALPAAVEETVRRFYVYPAGSIPGIGIEIANRRGARRIVRIDPMSGVAQAERLP